MSDTIVVMRTWVLVLSLVAACSDDPTLEVTVQHPMNLVIAKTTVTVYESMSLTCEMVEFGDLNAGQLDAVTVSEETLFPNAPSQGALANISRTGPKIVVARGYGSDGKLAAAGCLEVDDIAGKDEVTIATEVAVIGSISIADPTGVDLYGVDVLTTDATGKTVVGRPVSWRTYGPTGTQGASMAGLAMVDDGVWQPVLPSCTADTGTITIHPVPPNLIGGYAVQVRVAWAIDPVPLFSALTKLDLTDSLAALAPSPTTSPKLCALGHMAGNPVSPVIACISGNNSATIFTASVAGGRSVLTSKSNVPVTAPVGLFSLAVGNDLDIYAVDASAKLTLIYGGSQPPACKPAVECLGNAFDDLQLVPACGASGAKLLLHTVASATASQVKQLDLSTGALTQFGIVPKADILAKVSFNAAGCMPDLDAKTGTSTLEQVTALDFTSATNVITRAHFACPATGNCESFDLPGGAGVGFGPDPSPDLITTNLDSTGVVLVSSVMVSQDGARHLVELDRVPSAALPHIIVTGQFDSDGGVDMIWDNQVAKRGTVLDIAYSRTVGDQPLTALSPPQVSFNEILSGDVNGDGFDDITLTTDTGVVVIPTRVAADTATLHPDPTCAP